MKKLLWLVLLLLVAVSTQAQLNNAAFQDAIPFSYADSGRVNFIFQSIGYSRNTEYFSRFQDGYTFNMAAIKPMISYQPHKNFKVIAGFWGRKDFGTASRNRLEPLFSLRYKIDSLELIVGTLDGHLNHNLPEPVQDFERVYYRPNESGIQLKFNRRTFKADVWLDWMRTQYKVANYEEELNFGAVTSTSLYQSENYKISLPINQQIYHSGGQLDTLSRPITTILNADAGLRIEYQSKTGFLRGWLLDGRVFNYRHIGPQIAFKQGNAIMLNAGVTLNHLGGIILSYWQGNKFDAPLGMPIYSSFARSMTANNYVGSAERQIIFIRFINDLNLNDLATLSLRFEPFYDFQNKRIDFSNGLFLNYRQTIRLK